MKNKYLSLLIILLITFIAPMIGSNVTSAFKEPWYSQIILQVLIPQAGFLHLCGLLYIY